MKRSTIILIIYFIVIAIVPIIPIIVIKSCTGDSHKEPVELVQTFVRRSEAPVRYLFVPEGESDLAQIDIHIRAVEKAGNPGRTLINGEVYDKDTLLIAANSQGEINIAYETSFALIIENHNPRATFYIDEADIDDLMISSRGDINIGASNIGTMVVTDSLGVGNIIINACNVGSLVSSRDGAQNLFIDSSNVGRITIPIGSAGYEIEDSNIGVMVNGGKRELVVGGSHMNMKIAIDADSLEEVADVDNL